MLFFSAGLSWQASHQDRKCEDTWLGAVTKKSSEKGSFCTSVKQNIKCNLLPLICVCRIELS